MFTALHETLRLEAHAEADVLVLRVFLGDRELDATVPLRQAVLRLIAGAPAEGDLQVLKDRGILMPLPSDPVPEVLQLRRTVRLEPVPVPQVVKVAGADGPITFFVEPENLAREAFVPRHWLGPAQKLLGAVRQLAPQRPDPQTFAALFDAVLADIPALDDAWERQSDRLVARLPLQATTLQYDLHLRFFGDRNPFVARRMHRHNLRLPPEDVPLVGRALSALQEGIHGLQLKEILGNYRPGKQLVLAFISRDMVASPVEPTEWEAGTHYLGHGSVYEHRSTRLWVDPWYPVSSLRDSGPPELPDPQLYLFTTEPQPDALFRMSRTVPVVVANRIGPDALTDRTALLLRTLGFEVTEVSVGETAAVAGVTVEHHEAGVIYQLDGQRTLLGRTEGAEVSPCDRLFTRPDPSLVCEHLDGLLEPFDRWLEPRSHFAAAGWEAAGRPPWWILDEERAGKSKTRALLDGLRSGPTPDGARIAETGPLS